MQTIDVADAELASLLVLDRVQAPGDPLRVVAHLRDGRNFSLTLLTLDGLRRYLTGTPAYVAQRVLVVRDPSEAAVLEAVRMAIAQGIERFGVLDAALEE